MNSKCGDNNDWIYKRRKCWDIKIYCINWLYKWVKVLVFLKNIREEKISQKFRPKKIDETRNYFIEEKMI